MVPFSGRVGEFSGRFSLLQSSVSGASKQFGILKVALASTGIGLIVVALGSLVTFLNRTQTGTEFLENAMNSLGAVVDVVLDRFAKLGESVFNFLSGVFSKGFDKLKASVSTGST